MSRGWTWTISSKMIKLLASRQMWWRHSKRSSKLWNRKISKRSWRKILLLRTRIWSYLKTIASKSSKLWLVISPVKDNFKPCFQIMKDMKVRGALAVVTRVLSTCLNQLLKWCHKVFMMKDSNKRVMWLIKELILPRWVRLQKLLILASRLMKIQM